MALLEIAGVAKRYGNFQALRDLEIQVDAGEIVALIGKNGAGKTTLLNIITRRIFPTEGDVVYKGATLLQHESKLDEFGILIEPTFIPYMNAFENLDIIARLIGMKGQEAVIHNLLKMVGLYEKRTKRTRTFSFGMKQRLGLAQALLNNPRFLILDEPFVGLDPLGKALFKDVICQKARMEGVGVLFSSHDLEDVEEICDRVVLIDSGEKKFDGAMRYEKRLVLTCSRDMHGSDFEGREGIGTDGSSVVVSEPDQMVYAMQRLDELGVQLVDYEVEKSSLYDLFKE